MPIAIWLHSWKEIQREKHLHYTLSEIGNLPEVCNISHTQQACNSDNQNKVGVTLMFFTVFRL